MAIFSTVYNISQPNFAILVNVGCSFTKSTKVAHESLSLNLNLGSKPVHKRSRERKETETKTKEGKEKESSTPALNEQIQN